MNRQALGLDGNCLGENRKSRATLPLTHHRCPRQPDLLDCGLSSTTLVSSERKSTFKQKNRESFCKCFTRSIELSNYPLEYSFISYARRQPFWSSLNTVGQGLNLSHLANQQVDRLSRNQSATSSDRLFIMRRKLNTAIQKQTPALFLVKPAYSYVVAGRVKACKICA